MLPVLRTPEQAPVWSPSAHQFETQATHSDGGALAVLCMNQMTRKGGSVNTRGYLTQTLLQEGARLRKSGSERPAPSVEGQTS